MKNRLVNGIILTLVILITFNIYSCKDTFEITPQDELSSENHFKSITDADKAVVGVYGKLMTLANQYEILNELRGDLIDVTPNADKNLNDINLHNVKQGNPYADPIPFYSLINNCNDALKNFIEMRSKNLLRANEFTERYTDIISVRCWLYLQLGIHYGEIPYVTEPIENVADIAKIKSQPKIGFNILLDSLIFTMESITKNIDPYLTFSGSFDVSVIKYYWIHKDFLLGELYMWKGDYLRAASSFRNIMSERFTYNPANLTWSLYHKNAEYWVSGGINNYSDIFRVSNTSLRDNEYVWVMDFNNEYVPHNIISGLFAQTAGGKYLLKPSKNSIDNWRALPGTIVDFDPRGENASWRMENGNPVAYKLLYYQNEDFKEQQPGRWYIWRQVQIYMYYAECINRLGKCRLALNILNGGPHAYCGDDINVTKETGLSFPFNFNSKRTADKFPGNNADLGEFGRTAGIRGRAFRTITVVPSDTNMYVRIYSTAPSNEDSIKQIEEKLVDECALELAYEGHRWPYLLRVALRKGTDGPAYLANKIYNKLVSDGNPHAAAVKAKLMDPINWYLPFPSE